MSNHTVKSPSGSRRGTKAEVPVDGQVRIASNTKMFTAVVVLQLAAEGKIKLDAPVEKYLPKVICGKGNDGREITTRQLLQHTSGLHSYTANMPSIFKIQHTYSDVNRFLVALMDGTLLKQMKETMKAPDFPAGWMYGLGLLKTKLSCGGHAYGHGGDIDGYETCAAITEDGRAATIAVTALPTTQAAADKVNKALDTALCA